MVLAILWGRHTQLSRVWSDASALIEVSPEKSASPNSASWPASPALSVLEDNIQGGLTVAKEALITPVKAHEATEAKGKVNKQEELSNISKAEKNAGWGSRYSYQVDAHSIVSWG